VGAEQHEKDMLEYVDRDFDDAGAEVRSLDQRERKVGLFGDWLEVGGHGKCVEWVQDEETALYTLEVVREENGMPRVPRAAAIMEWALKAAQGDKAIPKGGRPEYRDGPQFKSVGGKRQGQRMCKAPQQAFGRGAFSKSKYRFTTIEQYVSTVRKFYDEALRDTEIANPARNARLLKVVVVVVVVVGGGGGVLCVVVVVDVAAWRCGDVAAWRRGGVAAWRRGGVAA